VMAPVMKTLTTPLLSARSRISATVPAPMRDVFGAAMWWRRRRTSSWHSRLAKCLVPRVAVVTTAAPPLPSGRARLAQIFVPIRTLDERGYARAPMLELRRPAPAARSAVTQNTNR
jgi:hypothetical protein